VTRSNALRFRQNGAILVAAAIAFIGAMPLAGVSWALAPLLLIPLAVGVWAWRSGTDADTDGLRIRALFGTRAIGWPRVAELAADPRGRVSALLTDGHMIRLNGVSADGLPKLIEASGQKRTADETDAQ
jgi:hypothetical protein